MINIFKVILTQRGKGKRVLQDTQFIRAFDSAEAIKEAKKLSRLKQDDVYITSICTASEETI